MDAPDLTPPDFHLLTLLWGSERNEGELTSSTQWLRTHLFHRLERLCKLGYVRVYEGSPGRIYDLTIRGARRLSQTRCLSCITTEMWRYHLGRYE